MIAYIVRRLAIGVVLFFGLLATSFMLVSLLPGDPAQAILGDYATPAEVDRLNQKLGLDKPFWPRLGDYMWNALHGNLGESFFTGRPVLNDLLMRVPNTLVYLVPGLLLALVFGIVFGTVAAARYRRPVDRTFTVWSTIVLALPEFVLALALIFVFFNVLHIAAAPVGMVTANDALPPVVTGSPVVDSILGGYWGTFWSILNHATLSIVTVAIFFSAPFAKIVRTGMIQAFASPQIEFARACGLRPLQVFRYALVDIRGSVMTYFVILLSSALSGAAIVESVFSWPGIGGWALKGVLANDMPVIQGFVVVMGTASIAGYVLLDIATTLLDPRTRVQLSRRGKRSTSRPLAPAKLDLTPELQ